MPPRVSVLRARRSDSVRVNIPGGRPFPSPVPTRTRSQLRLEWRSSTVPRVEADDPRGNGHWAGSGRVTSRQNTLAHNDRPAAGGGDGARVNFGSALSYPCPFPLSRRRRACSVACVSHRFAQTAVQKRDENRPTANDAWASAERFTCDRYSGAESALRDTRYQTLFANKYVANTTLTVETDV